MVNPDNVTVIHSKGNRTAIYKSQSGWPVYPDDILSGDIIRPSEESQLPTARLLVRPNTDGKCEFCPNDGPADYDIVNADTETHVASVCHLCISGNQIKSRRNGDYTVDEVYEKVANCDNSEDDNYE